MGNKQILGLSPAIFVDLFSLAVNSRLEFTQEGTTVPLRILGFSGTWSPLGIPRE